MANWITTMKCTGCQTVYSQEKYSKPTTGTLSSPNAGTKCPGCGTSKPATVVGVTKG